MERAACVHILTKALTHMHTHTHTKQMLYVNKGNFFITKEMSAAEVMDATSLCVCVCRLGLHVCAEHCEENY